MRKFDQHILEYIQLSSKTDILFEADDQQKFTDWIGSLLQATPFIGGKPINFITLNYDPSNVYYLIGGKSNINTLRQTLNIDKTKNPITSATQIFDKKGKIINDSTFSLIFYNAFDTAINTNNRNSVTLKELITQEMYAKSGQEKQKLAQTVTPQSNKIHQSIMKFITEYHLTKLIYYMTPVQAQEADKGGFSKRVGGAINRGIMTGAKSLGQQLTKNGVNYI